MPAWQGKVVKTSPLLCLSQAVSGPATPVVSCLNPTRSFGSIFCDSDKPWCHVACSPVDCFNFSFLILTLLQQHYVMLLLSGLRVRGFFTFVIFRLTIALAIFSSKPQPRAGFVLDFRADCSQCASWFSSAKKFDMWLSASFSLQATPHHWESPVQLSSLPF